MLEVAKESMAALRGAWWLLACLLLTVALALGVERKLGARVGAAARQRLHAALVLVAVGVGLGLGWRQRFLCDDAYISFRYARNFADGYGLVWNKGEWVEGYTNFLWTALLGVAGKLGADIPRAALFGCLGAFVLALVATSLTVRRTSPRPPLLPFAVFALAASLPFHTFATSGLETMLGAALVATAVLVGTLRRGALYAGLVLTAASLTRPDHVLFFGCFGLAMLGEDLAHGKGPVLRRLDFRRYAEFAAPFLLIFLPYYLLRWRAYGDFYPNTYYAKSGDLTYWKQGEIYAAHFAGASGAWAWIPALLFALTGWPRTRNETRLRLFAALALPVFGTYVIKVGGDFMEYRFFVPLLPIVAAAAEVGLRWKIEQAQALWVKGSAAVLATVGAAAAMVPLHLIPPRAIKWGMSSEPTHYALQTVWPITIDSGLEATGKAMRAELFDRGLEPRVGAGAIGMIGYHSHLPIVDALGLTSRLVAHKPISHRTRVGHEKLATVEDLLAEGAVLRMTYTGDPAFREASELRIGAVKLYFIRFDPIWNAELGKIQGARVPFPDRDVNNLVHTATRERLVAAIAFYTPFLALHPRRDALLQRLKARLAELEATPP